MCNVAILYEAVYYWKMTKEHIYNDDYLGNINI